MVEDDYFTDLPVFQALPHQVLFGLHPDAAKQRYWDRQGDIHDDVWPENNAEAEKGLMFFSGDPGKGAHSRSTLLAITTVEKHLLSNRKTPWEVPIGKVVKGLDVLDNIFKGYGDQPKLGMLNASHVNRPAGWPDAKAYWAQFPKFDRFKSCRVYRDREARSTDPNSRDRDHDEL